MQQPTPDLSRWVGPAAPGTVTNYAHGIEVGDRVLIDQGATPVLVVDLPSPWMATVAWRSFEGAVIEIYVNVRRLRLVSKAGDGGGG